MTYIKLVPTHLEVAFGGLKSKGKEPAKKYGGATITDTLKRFGLRGKKTDKGMLYTGAPGQKRGIELWLNNNGYDKRGELWLNVNGDMVDLAIAKGKLLIGVRNDPNAPEMAALLTSEALEALSDDELKARWEQLGLSTNELDVPMSPDAFRAVAIDNILRQQAERAGAESDPEPNPTEDQIKAGNYRKKHMTVSGIGVTIENVAGSTRSGVAPDGTKWSCKIPADYGYIKRTEGADGDHVDCYIGDDNMEDEDPVHIINQQHIEGKDAGKFDEHKCMIGWPTEADARKVYVSGFDDGKGEDRIHSVHTVPFAAFKRWVFAGDTTVPANGMDIINDHFTELATMPMQWIAARNELATLATTSGRDPFAVPEKSPAEIKRELAYMEQALAIAAMDRPDVIGEFHHRQARYHAEALKWYRENGGAIRYHDIAMRAHIAAEFAICDKDRNTRQRSIEAAAASLTAFRRERTQLPAAERYPKRQSEAENAFFNLGIFHRSPDEVSHHSWFKALSKEAQKKYLEAHPRAVKKAGGSDADVRKAHRQYAEHHKEMARRHLDRDGELQKGHGHSHREHRSLIEHHAAKGEESNNLDTDMIDKRQKMHLEAMDHHRDAIHDKKGDVAEHRLLHGRHLQAISQYSQVKHMIKREGPRSTLAARYMHAATALGTDAMDRSHAMGAKTTHQEYSGLRQIRRKFGEPLDSDYKNTRWFRHLTETQRSAYEDQHPGQVPEGDEAQNRHARYGLMHYRLASDADNRLDLKAANEHYGVARHHLSLAGDYSPVHPDHQTGLRPIDKQAAQEASSWYQQRANAATEQPLKEYYQKIAKEFYTASKLAGHDADGAFSARDRAFDIMMHKHPKY